jgi:hypothetical protein
MIGGKMKKSMMYSSLVLLLLAGLLGLVSFGCRGYGQTDPLGASGAGGSSGGGTGGGSGTVPTATPTLIIINIAPTCSGAAGANSFVFGSTTGLFRSSYSTATTQQFTCGATLELYNVLNGDYKAEAEADLSPIINFSGFNNGHIDFDLTVYPYNGFGTVAVFRGAGGTTWPHGTSTVIDQTTGAAYSDGSAASPSGANHFHVPISYAYGDYFHGKSINSLACVFEIELTEVNGQANGGWPLSYHIASVSNITWSNQ